MLGPSDNRSDKDYASFLLKTCDRTKGNSMKTEIVYCLTTLFVIAGYRISAELVVSVTEQDPDLDQNSTRLLRTLRFRFPGTELQHSVRRYLMPLGTSTVNATLITDTPKEHPDDLLGETNTSKVDANESKDDEALEPDKTTWDISMSMGVSMDMNNSVSSQGSHKSSKSSNKSGDDAGTPSPSTTYQPTVSPSTTSSPSTTYSPTSVKGGKSSKSDKSAKREKHDSYTPTQTPVPTSSSSKSSKSSSHDAPSYSPAPSSASFQSKSSKSQKTSSPTSESSRAGENIQRHEGSYNRLVDFTKTCSSNGSCLRANDEDNNFDRNLFCQGGMDITQEFHVSDWGLIQVHLDISWDFGLNSYGCGLVSRQGTALTGNGWLPLPPGNSYVCYTDEIYRIPQAPNLNEHFFSGAMEIVLPDGKGYNGQILAGAVCEMRSGGGVYLQIMSLWILGLIPGYSVSLRYEFDEKTMEVVEYLSGAPHIVLETDDSMEKGVWDHLRPDNAIELRRARA